MAKEKSKNELPNKEEKEENDSNQGIIGILTSRLSHPFLGTYIISFAIFNFNKILKLIMGLNDKYVDYEVTIDTFTAQFDLYSENVLMPLIPTLLFPPIVNYLGKTTLIWSSTFFGSWMDNIRQRNKKREYNEHIKVLENDLQISKNVYLELILERQFLVEKLEIFARGFYNHDDIRYLSSEYEYSENDIVSLSLKKNTLISFSNKFPLHFLVLNRFNNKHYIVTTLNYELLCKRVVDLFENLRKLNDLDGSAIYHVYSNLGAMYFKKDKDEKIDKYLGDYEPANSRFTTSVFLITTKDSRGLTPEKFVEDLTDMQKDNQKE